MKRGKVKTIKVGNLSFPVYRVEVGRGKMGFQMAWRDKMGKRHFICRMQMDAIESEARVVAARMLEGATDVLEVSAEKIQSYRDAEKRLGVPLEVAVDFYLAYAKQHNITDRSVSELVAEYYEYQKKSSPSHQTDCVKALKPLTEKFNGYISQVTNTHLSDWMNELGWKGRMRNNRITTLRAFFTWAKKVKNALPPGETAVDRVPKEKVLSRPLRAYTPEQMKKMLHACVADPELIEVLPLLVLGGFCGIRSAEITGEETKHGPLDWREVNWGREASIYVNFQKVEAKGSRYAPFPPNAKAWLSLVRTPQGPIWRHSRYRDWLNKVSDAAGVDLIVNGLRKSFISYRTAMNQNPAITADECGTSVEKIKTNYRRAELKSAARKWFSILPAKA